MLKKGLNKAVLWLMVIFLFAGLLTARMPIVAHAASSRGAVHVTNAQIVVSEQGAIYRPDRNLYLVGPTGWVEWHFTVKEKITDLVGLDYFFERGENEDVFSYKSAILDRVIDDQTLVFRFEPNNPQSAYLDFNRISEVGVIYYEVTENGKTVTKEADKLDLNGIKGMARVYFRNEWPKFTLSPNQMDLLDDDGYVAEGLTLDKIAVDIYDDILQPEDFEIQYTITPGNILVPWKTCSDRNLIEISEQARQGSVSIFMEIRDVVGNYRPYSISFPKRGEAGECRIHMDQLNILAGESMYDYLPIHQYNPWHEDPIQEMNFQQARRVFKQNQYVYMRPQIVEPELAVFVYSRYSLSLKLSNGKEVGRYTKSAADIDADNLGFIWSTNPIEPDPDDPVFRFKKMVDDGDGNMVEEKRYYKAMEYVSAGGYFEGYWCLIRGDWYDLDEEGEYYLYVVTADKITGGRTTWRVIYNRDEIPSDGRMYSYDDLKRVTYIVDKTPPKITFDKTIIDSGGKVGMAVQDNHGVLAAQYQICTDPNCTEHWHDSQVTHDIVTGPIGPDAEKQNIPEPKKVEHIIDTSALELTESQTSFKIHARAVDSKHFDYGASWSGKNPFEYVSPENIVYETKDCYKPLKYEGYTLNLSHWWSADSDGSGNKHKIMLHDCKSTGEPANKVINYTFDSGYEGSTWYGYDGEAIEIPDNTYFHAVLYGDRNKVLDEITMNFSLTEDQARSDISVSFSTHQLTDVVTATFTCDHLFRINNEGEFATTQTMDFTKNGAYPIYYQIKYSSADIQSFTKTLSIGNIREYSFKGITPQIRYSTQKSTSGDVTAYLYVGREIKPKEGVTYQDGWVSHTFKNIGSFVFDVEGLHGEKLLDSAELSSITANVTWINKTPPNCTLSYSTLELTKEPVNVTISCPSGVKVINNRGQTDYTFYKNGSFVFQVEDQYGTPFEFKAIVQNIDNEPPEITLQGPLSYPVYKGLPFEYEEPGFTAIDNMDGDMTDKVDVVNNVDIYKGGYYEIVYTATDSVGNTSREVRGVMVYDNKGIELLVNDVRVAQGTEFNKGLLQFKIAGLENPEYTMKYLPGKKKATDFKDAGIVIHGDSLTLDQEGWYTFYIRDEEMRMFVGHVYLK